MGNRPSVPSLIDFSTAGVMKFTSGGVEVFKWDVPFFFPFPIVLIFIFDISCSSRQQRMHNLKILWQRNCTQRGRNFNGVLCLFYASALILLILTLERYFKKLTAIEVSFIFDLCFACLEVNTIIVVQLGQVCVPWLKINLSILFSKQWEIFVTLFGTSIKCMFVIELGGPKISNNPLNTPKVNFLLSPECNFHFLFRNLYTKNVLPNI